MVAYRAACFNDAESPHKVYMEATAAAPSGKPSMACVDCHTITVEWLGPPDQPRCLECYLIATNNITVTELRRIHAQLDVYRQYGEDEPTIRTRYLRALVSIDEENERQRLIDMLPVYDLLFQARIVRTPEYYFDDDLDEDDQGADR